MSPQVPPERSENAGVLRYVGQGNEPADVTIERPTPGTDRWRLGAHPDVVERLWTDLAASLPPDSPRLVAGGAALVDPRTGILVAVALGTSYAVRLRGSALAEARARGCTSVREFQTVGRTLDLEASFGPGWVFGAYEEDEGAWLAASGPDHP